MRRAFAVLFPACLILGLVRTPLVDVVRAGQEPKTPRLAFFGSALEGHGPEAYTNLYLVMGDEHHCIATITEDHIILVDTKATPGWGAAIMKRLEQVTDQEVTSLIVTNPHQGGSSAEHGRPSILKCAHGVRSWLAGNAAINIRQIQAAG